MVLLVRKAQLNDVVSIVHYDGRMFVKMLIIYYN